MNTVKIISFGYLHGTPPEAHLTADLRRHFRDPHVSPALRHLTAEDLQVMDAVLSTDGIVSLAAAVADAAQAYLAGPSACPVTVAVGCAGGRHRAPAVAEVIAVFLRNEAIPVTVEHRDIAKPVVEREAA